jgi:chemotaxis protein CheY-P-specific phosphatase CheC
MSENTTKNAEAVRVAYAGITGENIQLEGVKEHALSFHDFLEEWGKKKSDGVAITVYFIIYEFDAEGAKKVAGYALTVFESENNEPLDEAERSYKAETANMLIGAYLGSLSNLSGQNLRASIQPIFKSTVQNAAGILKNQLFKGNKEKRLALTEIHLKNHHKAQLYLLLKT